MSSINVDKKIYNTSVKISVFICVLSAMMILLNANIAEAAFIIQRPLYIGLSNGLVGSWSFDGPDMAGVTAYDRSGNGKNGTLTQGSASSTVATPTSASSGSASAASITTSSFTPSQKNLVIMGCKGAAAGGVGAATFSDTFGDTGGSSWQQITKLDNGGQRRSTVGYRTIGSNPSTGTATCAVASATSVAESTVTTNGHDINSPISESFTVNDSAGSAASWAGNFGGVSSVNLLYSATLIGANEAQSPATNWTEIHDTSGRFETQYRNNTTETSAGSSWTTSAAYTAVAIEFAAGTTITTPLRTLGRIGQAVELGGGGYVDMGNAGSGIKTISFLMKALDVTSKKIINIDGTDQIETNASDQIVATSFPAATVYVDGIIASTVKDNTWHQVVITDTTGVSGSTFELGRVSTSYFTGKIDDVRIYNRALSQDEIRRLYKMGATTKIGVSSNTGSLSNGLVGYWSFDGKDMAGVKAYDRSGNTNDGTLTNGPVRTVGKLGQALSFDGSNDYVTIPSQTYLQGNQNLTISLWFKYQIKGTANEQYIITKKFDAESADYFLSVNESTGAVLWRSEVADIPYNLSSASNVAASNTWYHYIAVLNKTADILTLYINGAQVAQDTTFGSNSDATSQAVEIGARSNASVIFFFSGSIDDVRIYNRVLSQDEIRRLYKIGATTKINVPSNTGSLSNGLMGSWSFDGPDMADVTAYDRSGSGNNGTLTNGPVRVAGKIGQALSFDGSDDYIAVPDSTLWTFNPGTEQRSASAWVKFDDIPVNDGPVIWRGMGGTNNYAFFISDTSGTRVMAFWDGTSTFSCNNINFKMGQWYHLVWVVNAGTIDCYIDSTAGGSASGITSVSRNPTSVAIGGQNVATNYLDGTIDDVRIYNRVLSQDEIKRLYNMGR